MKVLIVEPGKYPRQGYTASMVEPSRQLSAAPSRPCTLGGIAPVSSVMTTALQKTCR